MNIDGSNGIVVFAKAGELDWRPAGAALPAGSVPLEVTRTDASGATTVELHAHDGDVQAAIIAVRNAAIEEMAEFGEWP